jgi:hypothetical protein
MRAHFFNGNIYIYATYFDTDSRGIEPSIACKSVMNIWRTFSHIARFGLCTAYSSSFFVSFVSSSLLFAARAAGLASILAGSGM